MDKIEFREKYDEMKELFERGKVEDAVDLADSINWRKVNNVNALTKAAEIYEAAERDQDARELLYIAHDRSPIGRMILYQLAMVCIRMGDLDEAQEYYTDFVEIAPHDSLKYILKYHISKAKGASDDTLIAILEEYKEHEFVEEWAYELAYLYHRTMRVDKCIELCDEIILWFGDGPYVERALEMKMLYQPLDREQEEKYRSFQNRRDGLTEIKAYEQLDSGEIISKNMMIPQVQPPTDRFNTVNLQAEIKKNIDEIMRATEEEVVAQNMENIKTLVEEIPYLQTAEEEEEIAEEQKQAQEKIDAQIRDKFQDYLAEEYDGQMSLFIPEEHEEEEQVEGQMSIEDVIEEWEKTRRAAEATLLDAQQQKLESAKNIALKEAGQIMDRLEEVIPKLDAGATTADLLREQYLAESAAGSVEIEPMAETPVTEEPVVAEPEEVVVDEAIEEKAIEEELAESVEEMVKTGIEESAEELSDDGSEEGITEEQAAEKPTVFTIPKVEPAGTVAGVGLEIPIVHLPEEQLHTADIHMANAEPIAKSSDKFATKQWKPPVLDKVEQDVAAQIEPEELEATEAEQHIENEEVTDVDLREASKLVEDMNNMLQQEIDRILKEDGQDIDVEEQTEELGVIAAEEKATVEKFVESEQKAEESEGTTLEEQDVAEEAEQQEVENLDAEAGEEDEQLPEIQLPEDFAEPEEELGLSDEEIEPSADETDLPEIAMPEFDDDEIAELVNEETLEKAVENEILVKELTEEEQEIFSYFMPIAGMESKICQALAGARYRLESSEQKLTGNVIIEGYSGSGKTMLASNLIKVLQNETGKLTGPTGKIEAKQLNNKDIAVVLSKVEGGSLIVEKAGDLSEASMTELVRLISAKHNDVFFVLEDEKGRIEERLGRNMLFANMFTEKISIPIFTIDELVNFGKVYALEEGYAVDEMGVLAMYNRINLISRVDRPTSLIEVRDIMEDAINHAERGGIKGMFSRMGSKRYDEEGNLILREQDFAK